MAFLKVGIAVAPGFARCGDVRIASIGIPRSLAQAHGIRMALVEDEDIAPLLGPLSVIDHKNRRGHALVIAGSPGKRGAGRLAADAALRAGAGLVTLAGPGGEFAASDPVMTAELDASRPGVADVLGSLVAGKAAAALGPGMQTGDGARELVFAALETLEVPLVLDADGLNHIGTELERVAGSQPPVVLTPHPGEAARLLGTTTAEINADRVGAVRRLAERTRAVVVLKGARTLVCDGISDVDWVTVNPTGNPGLATAGTGDVLTGLLCGLLAQGIAPADAARAAVYIHGRAGDLAAVELGERSIVATDVTAKIPAALRTL